MIHGEQEVGVSDLAAVSNRPPRSGERPAGSRLLKVVLVSPKGPLYRHRGGIFRRSLRYMPLTFPTLAALVPDELVPIAINIRLCHLSCRLRTRMPHVAAGSKHIASVGCNVPPWY